MIPHMREKYRRGGVQEQGADKNIWAQVRGEAIGGRKIFQRQDSKCTVAFKISFYDSVITGDEIGVTRATQVRKEKGTKSFDRKSQ